MMRIAAAVLIAPLAVPTWFRIVLGFYVTGPVEEAAPLLPGMLGVIAYLSYLVTLVALPVWMYLQRRYRMGVVASTTTGCVLGLLVAAALVPQMREWPAGLLLWSGSLGGGTAALLLSVIAGRPTTFLRVASDNRR